MDKHPSLFEEPEQLYELFDAHQRKILRHEWLKPSEIDDANSHYRKAKCPHIQYRLKQ